MAIFPRIGMADDSPGASTTLGVTPAFWVHASGHEETQQAFLGERENPYKRVCAGSDPH